MRIRASEIWRDAAFSLAWSVAANACVFGSSLMVIRYFRDSRSSSDPFFLLNSILVLGFLIANMGIPSAAAKLIAGGRGDRSPLIRSTFALTCFSTAIAIAALWGYALLVSTRPYLRSDLLPLSLCVLCFAPCKWTAGVLQGAGSIRLAAAFEAGLEIGRFGAVAGVLSFGGDAHGILRAWAAVHGVHLLSGMLLLGTAKRRMRSDAHGNASPPGFSQVRSPAEPVPSLSGTARLALSLFLPFAGLFVLNHGLTLFLAERGAPGDAGRWTISLQLLSLLPLLAGPMGTVLLPHFSRGAAGGEESLRADAGPILARLGAILCAAAVALLIAAGPLAAFLFGDAAAAAVGTVRILIAFYLIEALKFALDPLLIALNLWGTLARLEAARLALALPAGYWAVGKWSLTGAAAVLASAIAVSAAGKWALYRTAAKPIRERESHALG